jgi:hypothetical protein
VVVKEGGPFPDVSTPEKLKAAVLAARSLTYTDPATPNTSGAIAPLAKLGLLDEIKGKTRHVQGYTVYEAAVLSKGSTDQAATAFVKYLASAAAAAHWSEAKLEPATTYMRTRASQ